MRSLDRKWRKIESVMEARAIEYEDQYQEIAGGETGLFTWEHKIVGQSDDGPIYAKVHHIDYKLLQESREIERLAHEWDKRSASLKALHLHQHNHGKPDEYSERMAKVKPATRAALAEAYPELADVLRPESDTTPPVVVETDDGI